MPEQTLLQPKVQKAAELRSVYTDFSEREFRDELARVCEATRPERAWLRESLLPQFQTDREIIVAHNDKRLRRIGAGTGYLAIQHLTKWTPERSNPDHKNHYSPPFLRPAAAMVLECVGLDWKRKQIERDESATCLAVTSLVRSVSYQKSLVYDRERKVAMDTSLGDSGHTFGIDFDIDACGLYLEDPLTKRHWSVNPRKPEFYDEYATTIVQAREDLRAVLDRFQASGVVNYVEELPGTKENCMHISANPFAQLGDILDS